MMINKPEQLQPKKISDDEFFDIKKLRFEFDLSKTNYELDVLQNRFLEFYLRSDSRFRRAFYQNYTNDFIKYIRDKCRLNEPISLSVLGEVRSGKSFSSISWCCIHQGYYQRRFTIDYVCANAMEFLEKVKSFTPEKLYNRIFLIDEEKMSMFSVGSVARKMKLQDVQNIIAINNISTIMLNPHSFQNKDASYGLRTFGRDFGTKTSRLMLYNLQESAKLIPVGNLYIPIFTALLPEDYAKPLEKAYLKKKMEWVGREQRGEGDILAEIRKKSAREFMEDKQFLSLKKKNEKWTYISQKLGSEFTKSEIDEIFQVTKLLEQGIKL